MSNRGLNRRHVLQGVALVTGATVVGGLGHASPAAAAGQSTTAFGPNLLIGDVTVVGQERLVVRLPGGDLVTVRLAPGAHLSRGAGQDARQLSRFVPGDEIAAEGVRNGSEFTASWLTSLYRVVEGTVTNRQGDILETTTGVAEVGAYSHPFTTPGFTGVSPGRLRRGVRFRALAWRDPKSGHLLTLNFGANLSGSQL